jgi:AcrR family transcriptional regulator
MTARAEAAAATAERILDAAIEVFWERPTDRISLEDVAHRAGTTVQTVIRRFGGKDGLFAAAASREEQNVRSHRDQVVAGDTVEAVRVLVEHYEQLGDRVLKLLAEEDRVSGLRDTAERGRVYHREWCARVFEPSLARVPGAERRRRLAQFVAICDVFTWKLLRRDAGLSRRQTELAVLEMLLPLVEGHDGQDSRVHLARPRASVPADSNPRRTKASRP